MAAVQIRRVGHIAEIQGIERFITILRRRQEEESES